MDNSQNWDRVSLMMTNTNDVFTVVIQNKNDAFVGAVQTMGIKLKTIITKPIHQPKMASIIA